MRDKAHYDLVISRQSAEEEHRHACEVRYIATLGYDRRQQLLDGIEKARGREARQRIDADLRKTRAGLETAVVSKSKKYETSDDRRAETEIITAFCGPRKLVPRRVAGVIDFELVRDGVVKMIAECKDRSRAYLTMIVDAKKIQTGVVLAERLGVPFVWVMRVPTDDVRYVDIDRERVATWRLTSGGRTDRDDPRDIDSVYHIPIEDFIKVK